MSCSIGCRCGLDLVLLWQWCRLAAAALIQSLAREFPYAAGMAIKRKKKKKKEEEGKEKEKRVLECRQDSILTSCYVYGSLGSYTEALVSGLQRSCEVLSFRLIQVGNIS